MILNKPTTKPIKAKIAITAMALSNELLGFWFSISLQIAEKNKHAPLGQMKNPKNTKNVIKLFKIFQTLGSSLKPFETP